MHGREHSSFLIGCVRLHKHFPSNPRFEDHVCYNSGHDRMFGALLRLVSLAWDAVALTLDVGFVSPFVVDTGR